MKRRLQLSAVHTLAMQSFNMSVPLVKIVDLALAALNTSTKRVQTCI